MLKLMDELGESAAFDPETVRSMSVAFDSAWASLQASGASFPAGDDAEWARGILGKYIVRAAKKGDRDPKQLCEGALQALAGAKLKERSEPSERPGTPDFRKFAEQCLRWTDQFQTAEDKAVSLAMAQEWIRIADQVHR